jgi:hypothetical protein
MANEMRTKRQTLFVAFLLTALSSALHAGDMSLRIIVSTNEHRVLFTVVVQNATDQTINLMPRLSRWTNTVVSSSLLWRVNDAPAEFLSKRAFLMYPPFDTKVLPPHSTNAAALVEDDELFIVTETTNTHSRLAHPALPATGDYRIEVSTVGDWGGHTTKKAAVTIRIKKEPPANACTLSATSAEK